jgi:hypothetical protein
MPLFQQDSQTAANQDTHISDTALLAILQNEQAGRHRECWAALERQVAIAFAMAGRSQPDMAVERAYLHQILAGYNFESRLTTWLAVRIVQRARRG